MSEIDNVVEFKPRDPDAPALAVTRARFCQHRFMLDEASRSVSCTVCGRVFDAFDAFALAAGDWQRATDNLRHLRDQVLKAHEELKDIKRQVQNAKAQLRSAKLQTHSPVDSEASSPPERAIMTPQTSEPGVAVTTRARGQRKGEFR